MVFGPITFQQPTQWTQILAQANEPVDFLTLWYERPDAGTNADGEYAWIYQDEAIDNYQDQHVEDFYTSRVTSLPSAGGIAFPGFDDFYAEGGGGYHSVRDSHENGQVLATTLGLAESVQQIMSTFSNWQLGTTIGEGTMFEPTVETGYDYLLQLQDFTGGLLRTQSELELVFQLYRARKEFVGESRRCNPCSIRHRRCSATWTWTTARSIIDSVLTPGDFNEDGGVDGSDFLVWQRELGQTGYYPLQQKAADTNADGIVDTADLALWQQYYGYVSPLGALTASVTVPEPTSLILCLLGLVVPAHRRRRRR